MRRPKKNKAENILPTEPAQKKQNVGYRLLAALFAVVCIGFCFLPIHVFGKAFAMQEQALWKIVIDIVKSDTKIFGFLPVLTGTSTIGIGASAALYLLVAAILVGVVLCIIALFTAKKSPALLRTAAFVVTVGAAVYALSVVCISAYAAKLAVKFDVWSLVLAGAGAALYFALMLAKVGNVAWLNAMQIVFSTLVCGAAMLAVVYDGHLLSKIMHSGKLVYEILLLAILALALCNLLITAIRAMTKKGLVFDLCRYIVMLVAAVVGCCLNYIMKLDSKAFTLFMIVAAAVSLVQIVIVSVELRCRCNKHCPHKEKAPKPVKAREERVARPYDGAPVPVNMAKERPVVAAQAAPKTTVSAPVTNVEPSQIGNKFDPFMMTLTDEEKSQFVDLYILKCNGPMPEIPAYNVGEDNRQFFNKIFIYLGQYREKIPDGLLAKMYQFTMKIN
ncbi:MAG: hypothetical protein IJZ32_04940 [Clostridia bacterium]|nr:hypothetical protein [Clostridia bacterium]